MYKKYKEMMRTSNHEDLAIQLSTETVVVGAAKQGLGSGRRGEVDETVENVVLLGRVEESRTKANC
jgi:hypothetical protein